MIWSPGQVHWQYSLGHFRSLSQCNFFHLPFPSVHPAHIIHPRWATLTIRPKSTATESCTSDPKTNHTTRLGDNGLPGHRETHQRTKLDIGWMRVAPIHLIAIDTLFTRRMKLEEASSYLQRFPFSDILLHRLQDRDQARVLAENFAGTRFPHRALWTLVIARNLGARFKQNAYDCVVHRLAEGRHWDLVLSVVGLGKQHTGRTTIRLLNWRIRALIATSKFKLLDEMLTKFERESLQPNRKTFHLLVSGHIRNRNLRKAKEYLSKMEVAGFPIEPSTHALIVSVYRSLGPDVDVRQKAFDSLGQIGDREATVVLNSLIQFALDADDVTSTIGYLSLFNVPADVIVQDGNSSVSNHSPSRPIQRAIRPDPATFTMLINHASKKGDLGRVYSIIQKMESCGVRPDSFLIANLIPALCKENDIKSAVSIVARICDSKPTPPALLSRLGLDPETQSSVPVVLSGISPDVRLFNALMKGVSTSLGINGMRVVLRLMHANGVLPDVTTIEILAAYLITDENPHPRTLIRTMRSLLSRPMKPTLKLMHAIMKVVIRQQKLWLRNNTVLDQFADGRQEPQPFEPVAGVYMPKKLSYPGMTKKIRHSLRVRGIRTDRVTVSLRMKQAALQGDIVGVEAAFRSMLGRGMHANVFHYAGLMHAHAEAGNMTMAESIVHTALQAGVKPNPTMFTILIVGYGRQGDPNTAMRVFEDMVAQGIKPDKAAIHAVAAAYYISGSHSIARKVLLDLWPSVAPLPGELRTAKTHDVFRAFHNLRKKVKRKSAPPISSRRQQILRWKLRRFMEVWRSLCRKSSIKPTYSE
jgi:pentatricopeptide repeat protein